MAADEHKELEEEVTQQEHDDAAAEVGSMTEVDGVPTHNPDDATPEPEPEPAPAPVNLKDVLTEPFEKVLTRFFTRYHKARLGKVAHLVETYGGGYERQVLLYLANRYKVSPHTIEGTKNLPEVAYRKTSSGRIVRVGDAPSVNRVASNGAAMASDAVGSVADAPKKKGKGMLIVVILVIVLAGGGAGAYFSGMLGGAADGAADDHATEAPAGEAANEAAAEPAKEEPAPVEDAAPAENTDEAAGEGDGEANGEADGEADQTEEDIKEAAEAIDAVVGH